MNFPFSEENINKNIFIRTFKQEVEKTELIWHRDREDRIIKSINETDWLFQFDNELPIHFKNEIFIPKETYHRIIKGNGDLILEIKKI
jgi:hypothetical protein